MSCIVFYKNSKYDIGAFLDSHPGGRDIILELENKDITDAYENIGHSKSADKILSKYIIRDNTTPVADIQPVAQKQADNGLDIKFTTKKLFTPEDKFNIHKIFGLLSLLNFAYRYFYVLPLTNTLGYGGNYMFDTLTLVLHLALSYSSIIFHVLKYRIPERPLIIYTEYRLHAMVFTTRGILIGLLGMYSYLIPPLYRQYCATLIVFFTSIIVDYITYKYGTPGITAVRNNNEGSVKLLRLGYAYYQFIAMGSLLVLHDKSGDLGFNVLIAIQSSAFLMTLKRKSIIRWYSHAFWYSLALLLSSYYIWYIKGSFFMMFIAGLFLIRTQLNVSKYIIWAFYLAVSILYLG